MNPEIKSLLIDLIRCPSITPDEAGSFQVVRDYLGDEFSYESIEVAGIQNLWITKESGAGAHLCLAGHLDVVPPGEGWHYVPFEPIEEAGYLYGRGTQDMKAGVAAMLYAAKHSAFEGTLSLLLTADEEGEAIYGTKAVLEQLRSRHQLPDMAIVAEPTCEARFGDTIKIGRRGSINGTLTLKGKSGHVAYPDKCLNPTEALSRVLPYLAGVDLDRGDAHFAPSKLVITDIRGGYEVCNLTPGSIKLMFNVRNSTATDHGALEAYLKRVLQEAEIVDYELSIKPSSMPFMTPEGPLSRTLSEAIAHHCAITPQLGTGGGTSDARYFGAFGVPVVEFGPVNDRIHAPDERVPLEDVQKLAMILLDTVEAIAR